MEMDTVTSALVPLHKIRHMFSFTFETFSQNQNQKENFILLSG